MQQGYDQLYPHQFYRYMLESLPILPLPERHAWQIFRWADVQRVLLDTTAFSSQLGVERMKESIVTSDPPRHRQLRSLVTQKFTSRMVGQLEPRIEQIVYSLLDAVIPAGCMDIIDDFAHPLPITVIAEMLGVSTEDRAQFRRWSDAIVSSAWSAPEEQQIQSEMSSYFLQVIERRRQSPQDDLISSLLAAEIDGERLSEQDLLSFCVLLLVAGNETTTTLLGNAMLCFEEFPESLNQLRENPSLIPSAVEEVLRYRSPMRIIARKAKTDVTLGEHLIPAGDRAVLWLAAANVDERQFPNALDFDIGRSPNNHLGFGHGIHFCLGAPLARLEARIALRALLERLSEIQRIQDLPLEPILDSGTQGIKHFPITFQAR